MRVALTAVYNTFQAVDVWRVRRDDRWVGQERALWDGLGCVSVVNPLIFVISFFFRCMKGVALVVSELFVRPHTAHLQLTYNFETFGTHGPQMGH